MFQGILFYYPIDIHSAHTDDDGDDVLEYFHPTRAFELETLPVSSMVELDECIEYFRTPDGTEIMDQIRHAL